MEGKVTVPKIEYTQLFINNEWVSSADGSVIPILNPATGEKICDVASAKQVDVDKAVASAKAAFRQGSPWRQMDASKRGVLLNKLADLMERDKEHIASLETLDNGMTLTNSMRLMNKSIGAIRYFAGWADKNHGSVIPVDGDFFAYTRHEPIGVCAGIIPWNFPFNLFTWKFAPCIAAGNVFVAKPSELTPLSTLYIANLCREAGFPPGVVNVIPGYGNEAGKALSYHMDVDKIAFTGSVGVGRLIQKASADSNLKRVTLELGGKSPNIIFADVDVEKAVEIAHAGVFANAGQVCCAGSRIFVQDKVYDEFLEKSIEKAKTRKAGNPFEPSTQHGPQISELQRSKILEMINKGVKDGGKVHCGGVAKTGNGFFIEPTIITGLSDDNELSREEIFGPVKQIFKFKTIEEVIERANDTAYGLAAGVITNDINKYMAVANSVRAGTVWVNCYLYTNYATPFGGFKMSGIGRELGEHALKEYTEVKSVIVKLESGCPK